MLRLLISRTEITAYIIVLVWELMNNENLRALAVSVAYHLRFEQLRLFLHWQ